MFKKVSQVWNGKMGFPGEIFCAMIDMPVHINIFVYKYILTCVDSAMP